MLLINHFILPQNNLFVLILQILCMRRIVFCYFNQCDLSTLDK